MNALEKISHLEKLWEIAIPQVPCPSQQDIGRWCRYPLETMEAAIFRTAAKFPPTKVGAGFDPTQAYKYTSATARKMNELAQAA